MASEVILYLNDREEDEAILQILEQLRQANVELTVYKTAGQSNLTINGASYRSVHGMKRAVDELIYGLSY